MDVSRNHIALLLLLNHILGECLSSKHSSFESTDRNQKKSRFYVDYERKQFIKDGEPFTYLSGSFHYTRVPHSAWRDRLAKMRAGGLNAVQTYVPWNAHERIEGNFTFEGDVDLEDFIKAVHEHELLLILRAGPYSCGEWDRGWLPWFLLQSPHYGNITVRSSDPRYLHFVELWYDEMLPRIAKWLYVNNEGPIIMVQLENEFGSYGTCDHNYMEWLRRKVRKYLGNEIVLFTADGPTNDLLSCGSFDASSDVLPTLNFGITDQPNNTFNVLRRFNSNVPLVNSECYTGWFDQWGSLHHRVDGVDLAAFLDKMLRLNASVNLYMEVGGTTFDFWNGANTGPPPVTQLVPSTTSYDYDAPISVIGDTGGKYWLLRNISRNFFHRPLPPIPPNVTRSQYKPVPLQYSGNLLDFLPVSCNTGAPPVYSTGGPLPMEEVKQGFGFLGYVLWDGLPNNASRSDCLVFERNGVRDRAHVATFSEGTWTLHGVVVNNLRDNPLICFKTDVSQGDSLVILVENQGRLSYGPPSLMEDQRKGLIGSVVITSNQTNGRGNQTLQGWLHYPVNLSTLMDYIIQQEQPRPQIPVVDCSDCPSVYLGTLQLPSDGSPITDTFLVPPSELDKGSVLVKSSTGRIFNIGRYWQSAGPQQALYLPSHVIGVESNSSRAMRLNSDTKLMILELDSPVHSKANLSVSFSTNQIWKFEAATTSKHS